MQHLKVLEEAGLVVVRREGRVRWNHLDALPIKRLHDRWIGPYAERAVGLARPAARRSGGKRMSWTVADIPSLAGKRAIVTGSNSGIGYEAALALAGAGAETIVAARSREKGEAAVARIKARASGERGALRGARSGEPRLGRRFRRANRRRRLSGSTFSSTMPV